MIGFTGLRHAAFWILALLTTAVTVLLIVDRGSPAAAQTSPELVNLAVSDVRYDPVARTDSAILVVKTRTVSDIIVDYGPSSGSCPAILPASASSSGGNRHEVLLDSINPDSFYSSTVCYRVRDADTGSLLAESSFPTARRPGEPFSFGVVGDVMPTEPGVTSASAGWNMIARQMRDEDLDLALVAGDMVNNHWYESQAPEVEEKYNGFFSAAMDFTSRAPIYTAVGNHEQVYAPVCRTGYEREFTLPQNSMRTSGFGEHYYSFDSGDTHFIALSTEIPGQEGLIIGEQLEWLHQDLAASNKTWTVVFFHRPLFYPPGIAEQMFAFEPWFNPSDPTGLANREYLHDVFSRASVDLVFSGHAHLLYHHIEDGVSYVVAGSGGSDIPDFPDPAMGPGDLFFYEGFGHVRVDASLTTLAFSVIDAEGRSREQFTLNADRSYAVSVDSGDAPIISDVLPSGVIRGETATMSASFSDPPLSGGIDTSSIAVSVSGGTVSECMISESDITCSVEGLGAGEHVAEVAVSDRAGNRSVAKGAFVVAPGGSTNQALAMMMRSAYLAMSCAKLTLQFI